MARHTASDTLALPEGRYTILYGIHVRSQNPAELPHDTDGVVLETGMHQYLKDPLATLERLQQHVQYKALFRELEKRKIPVYFVDLKYRYPDPLLLFADTAFSGAEYMAGMKLLGKKKKRATDYLVGAWLLLPFFSNMLRLGSSFFGVGERQTGELKKFSHRLHPEADFLYLTLRNAVIAEKEKHIIQKLGKKPHLVTVLGAGHVGIEDTLQMTEEKRQKFFKRSLPIIKKLADENYVYQLVSFRYTGKEWNVEHDIVPNLQNLIVTK